MLLSRIVATSLILCFCVSAAAQESKSERLQGAARFAMIAGVVITVASTVSLAISAIVYSKSEGQTQESAFDAVKASSLFDILGVLFVIIGYGTNRVIGNKHDGSLLP